MATDHPDFKLYRYDPSIGAAVVFIVLFIITSGIHTYQTLLTRTWFLIPFVVGGHSYCLIRRRWLTKIFLAGDILSFIMQGVGGGIMASGTPSALTTGENIIIGGLVIQLIFFSLFVITSIKFHLGLRSGPSRKVLHSQPPWERHMYALYGGSALIFIRSLFRLIEYAQGNNGYLVSHEVYLYIFDAVLMVLVMLVFAWVHPSEVNVLLKPGGGGRAAERVFWLKMGAGESLQ
ncbi:RTA1 like protein-domain-containing protein [Aspergillus insuetus]